MHILPLFAGPVAYLGSNAGKNDICLKIIMHDFSRKRLMTNNKKLLSLISMNLHYRTITKLEEKKCV